MAPNVWNSRHPRSRVSLGQRATVTQRGRVRVLRGLGVGMGGVLREWSVRARVAESTARRGIRGGQDALSIFIPASSGLFPPSLLSSPISSHHNGSRLALLHSSLRCATCSSRLSRSSLSLRSSPPCTLRSLPSSHHADIAHAGQVALLRE